MLLPGTVYFMFVPRQGVSAPVSVTVWGRGGARSGSQFPRGEAEPTGPVNFLLCLPNALESSRSLNLRPPPSLIQRNAHLGTQTTFKV